MSEILDWLLTVGIVFGIFFLAYTTYRQQNLIDTVNEIRELFKDRADEVKEVIAYK